jgi:hypothetical protein
MSLARRRRRRRTMTRRLLSWMQPSWRYALGPSVTKNIIKNGPNGHDRRAGCSHYDGGDDPEITERSLLETPS